MTAPRPAGLAPLSPRLRALADAVPPGLRVADIGTDHALLPVHLVATGRAIGAIAVDLRPGAVAQARRTARRSSAADRVDVRLGDGLAALRAGEADVVVVSGMGGVTLQRVLGGHPAALAGVRRLALGPQSAVPRVRRWLIDAGWGLVDERLVRDDGVDYEILVAEPGDARAAYDWPGRPLALAEDVLLELGPLLARAAEPPWQRCWRVRCDAWQALARDLRRRPSVAAHRRADGLDRRAAQVRAAVEAAVEAAGGA